VLKDAEADRRRMVSTAGIVERRTRDRRKIEDRCRSLYLRPRDRMPSSVGWRRLRVDGVVDDTESAGGNVNPNLIICIERRERVSWVIPSREKALPQTKKHQGRVGAEGWENAGLRE
jgi:hypothetical protein